MPGLPDSRFHQLVLELRDRMTEAAPGWTETNVHDPGVIVLELVAYALEELAWRSTVPVDDVRLARVRRALDRLVSGAPAVAPACLTRTRYFRGRVLTHDDFEREQQYLRDRDRRLALVLGGSGVVRGLHVRLESDAVVVGPGVAVDRRGEVLVVDRPFRAPLAASTCELRVVVRHVEHSDAPLPSLEGTEDSVFVECAEVAVVESPGPNDVVLARVVSDGGARSLLGSD